MLRSFEVTRDGKTISPGRYAYVEAFAHQDTDGATRHVIEVDTIPESELEHWVWQKGKHSPSTASKLVSIRLLFAQARNGSAHTIPTTLWTANVLKGLHLPRCSFHSFRRGPGVFSAHTEPEHLSRSACTRLSLLFRTPQKWECSLGMFAVSHSFETRVTTALNLGYAFDLEKYNAHPPAILLEFIDQLKANQAYWFHPCLLPCMFLSVHTLRVESYLRNVIGPGVLAVKQYIGVTKAGTSDREFFLNDEVDDELNQSKLFVAGKLHHGNARRLTHTINDLSTWIIFTKRAPQWDIQCSDFLLDLINSDHRLHGDGQVSVKCIQEALHYIRNDCEACLENAESYEAQMKLQLEILYTSIAQDDGQTSVRIAASAGKDSTSMKIIALITAAYLPGTFIATLFSMGMFTWRSPGGDDLSSRASPDLWIYWAVTIPLTIITIAGWAAWWKVEIFRSGKDITNDSQGGLEERPKMVSRHFWRVRTATMDQRRY